MRKVVCILTIAVGLIVAPSTNAVTPAPIHGYVKPSPIHGYKFAPKRFKMLPFFCCKAVA